jgi:flagellar P-ring protein precursor FlgI
MQKAFLIWLITLIAATATLAQGQGVISKPESQTERTLVRVKDVAQFEGVRDNQLIGYGLVVGLNRTGDRVQQNIYARQTLQNLLERMGLTVSQEAMKPENMATVLVTANLPPFIRQGSRIDVTVSSIGDARSLQGGILVMTPLKGIDGQIYAIAQGPVSTGGFTAGNNASSVVVNHPTVGRVPSGALVEREVSVDLAAQDHLQLVLREGDFTAAARLAKSINQELNMPLARALDNRTVRIALLPEHRANIVELMAQIENVKFQTDMVARVVVNERTGTIVIGKHVRISSVSVSQGGFAVRIGTDFEVSQPPPLSSGQTTVVPQQTVEVTEKAPGSVTLPEGATIEEVVRGLRAVGATARDIINILQAIKAAGALQAELELN